MSLICLLVDWSQWIKETLSLKMSQLKLPELEKKWTKDSNKKQVACGTTIKYVHTIGIQGEEKGKRTEEIFKI